MQQLRLGEELKEFGRIDYFQSNMKYRSKTQFVIFCSGSLDLGHFQKFDIKEHYSRNLGIVCQKCRIRTAGLYCEEIERQ